MVKIIIAGDFAPRFRVSNLINDEKYGDVFGEVLKYTSNANYSIVNLEAPIVNSYIARPIDKYGPNLKCSSKAIKALKYAGFNMVTLANNHICDYGEIGVQDTLVACEIEGIDSVGAGHNLEEASSTFYKTIKGIKFAFINCCETEFSIATVEKSGANPLNPIRQFYKIREARKSADKVIVIVHGGHEHFNLPSLRMKETYRFFVDAGADVVVNHHQHCYSGYEIYKSSLIFYGLGNFCFDRIPVVNDKWNYGFMLQLDITVTNLDFRILPFCQCAESPSVVMLSNDAFAEHLERLNRIIVDERNLKFELDQYYDSAAEHEISILEPYAGRIMNKLYSLNLLPKLVKGEKRNAILNHVQCESHRDKIIFALEKK